MLVLALAATLAGDPERAWTKRADRGVKIASAAPAPSAPAPSGAEGPGIVFDGRLQLLSAVLSETKVRPGGAAEVRFAWRLLEPLPPEWRVFVHLRQRTYGGYLLQYDHAFADVGIDVDAWPAGEVRRYSLPLSIPEDTPASRAVLLIGIWDGKRNRPAAACEDPGPLRLAGAGRIIAGEIVLKP